MNLADGELALAGALGAIPIGAVLQLLQLEGQSGVVIVRSGRREIVVSMRAGTIDLVQSQGTGDAFRLGRFFVQSGAATAAEIEALIAARSTDAPPLGDVLLAAGKIDAPQLRAALVRQSSELIYEVFRWTEGTFEFRRRAPTPLATRARLAMPIATIIMEGFRRVDEWRVIEARIGRFEDVLLRDEVTIDAVGLEALPTTERAMLDLVDGRRTVRALVDTSHMSSFEACRTLAELVEARLVRRRVS